MADKAAAAVRADAPVGDVLRIKVGSAGMDSAKKMLAHNHRYADIMLVATLRDCERAKCALELNSRPAFKQNPSRIAHIVSGEEMNKLYNDVLHGHG